MSKPLRALRWPIFICCLLLIPIVANSILVGIVCFDSSFAVEHNYYQRALHYDEEIAQRARNLELGWSLAVEARRERKHSVMHMTLLDRAGAPIAGAALHLVAFPQAAPAAIVELTAATDSSGAIELDAPFARRGLWRVRCEAVRNAERFTIEQTVEAP